jgi:hypothetical protein
MVAEAKKEEKERLENKGKNIMSSFGWSSNNAHGNHTSSSSPRHSKDQTPSSSISTWFRSSVNKSKGIIDYEDDEDDEHLIAIIQSRLELDPSQVSGGADQFVLRLILTSSATLRLTSDSRPVAILQVNLLLSLSLSLSISLSFSLPLVRSSLYLS